MMKPKLRFRGNEIQGMASRYEYSISEVELLELFELRPKVQRRGNVSKEGLQEKEALEWAWRWEYGDTMFHINSYAPRFYVGGHKQRDLFQLEGRCPALYMC